MPTTHPSTSSPACTSTTRPRGPRRARLGAVTALAALLLAACGSSGDAHNDADVAFATEMIPHHSQAVEMAQMVDGKDVSPEVQALATDIEGAQDPEISTMTGWLESWDEPVPTTGGDMGDMASMPGMMSADDMTSLDQAEGAAFEEQWLTLMIEHHEGALTMATDLDGSGEYQPALDLAASIEASQSAEIAQMKELLAG